MGIREIQNKLFYIGEFFEMRRNNVRIEDDMENIIDNRFKIIRNLFVELEGIKIVGFFD